MSALSPDTLRYVLEYEPLLTKLAYLRLWMEEGPRRGEEEIHQVTEALDWVMSRDRPSQLSLQTEYEMGVVRDHAVALAEAIGTVDRADMRFHVQRKQQELRDAEPAPLFPLPAQAPPHEGESLDTLLTQLERAQEVDQFAALHQPGHNLLVLYRLLLPRLSEAPEEQQERFLRFLEDPRLRVDHTREVDFLSRFSPCYRSPSFCERVARYLKESELATLIRSLPPEREGTPLLVAAGGIYGLAWLEEQMRRLRQTDSAEGWRARLARLLESESAETRLLALRMAALPSELGPAEPNPTPDLRRSPPSRS